MSDRCYRCSSRIDTPARCLQGHDQPDRPPIQLESLAKLIAKELRTMMAEEFRVAAEAMPARADPASLVDVHEMARAAGMSEHWVYDHASELGGVKAGGTKRARWRFDRERALALLAERQDGPRAGEAPPTPERRELPIDVKLLPVRGRAA